MSYTALYGSAATAQLRKQALATNSAYQADPATRNPTRNILKFPLDN